MTKSIRTECKTLSDEELFERYKELRGCTKAGLLTPRGWEWIDSVPKELGTSRFILDKLIELEGEETPEPTLSKKEVFRVILATVGTVILFILIETVIQFAFA